MNSLFTKLMVGFIVVVAFIDGMLVADRFNRETAVAAPIDGVELESITYEEKVHEKSANVIIQDVPYTVQAPFGWTSPWNDYAEEASVYMAALWLNGQDLPELEQVGTDLLSLGAINESKQIGLLESLELLNDPKATFTEEITEESLIGLLQDGNILLVPVNGQLLESPYYADPAPEHHMLLIIGFNKEEKSFVTNDPGTVKGAQLTYEYEKILNAIQDRDGEQRVGIIQP